ncbi:MAG: hypothetical protein AAFX39_09520 [Pseudomonadota bacterium]
MIKFGCVILGCIAAYVYFSGVGDAQAASVLTGAVVFYATLTFFGLVN